MTWQAASLGVLVLGLLGGFAWYEHRRPPAKVIALVAALAALAVVGRLAFAAIPNVKPTTDIVLFAGYALGGVPGFAVGALTALVSNVFLGQGPWTAWQMAAWGGVGIAGAGLARLAGGRELGRVPLALACGLAGLAFGAVLDVYQWTLAAEQDLATYLAVSASSLPYNLAHAFGNVVFCLVLGPVFIRALRRYRRRFEVRWEPPRAAAAGTATAILASLLALSATHPEPAQASVSPSTKAVRYLARAQNRDGGLGGARGQASSQLVTGWSALGLAAAGRNPRDVARGRGPAITTYLRRAGSIRDTGELERTILVLKASGLSPRRFRGRDFVAELMTRRRADGSWQGNVALTAFGIFALRAAGDPPGSGSVQQAAGYLERAQNGDGGFGFVPSVSSDVDDTGAALQALGAAGRRGGEPARKAVAYLRAVQNGDGGFGQMEGRDSNAQSTAWAVQGLVAAGVRPASLAASPVRYLVRLQRRDGHIAYSARSDQTPVWVTAQALTALRGKPFPLATVPRKRRPRARVTAREARPSAAASAASRKAPRKRSRQGALRAQGTSAVRPTEPLGEAPASSRAGATRVGTSEGRDGPSAVVLALATLGALVVVALARRRLHRRRLAG
ncbi:MAG: prenyltransferase/squalene oxidase repeat-containing protein [Thermoleophilaceae bacterium]